ncbi:hypothetical protein [Sabulicella glaciei]|uniref:Secreted protein n=1 Tax=Sabulicella glaciei TaxID=2984948 RepID=A0ABT3NUL4_9PROT|nr:hypothetical protein [Roseococcus sp. MDT2-1-1]MCW8085850.1 hypothetical protein [Roseococcus sp. MDT2-1-1]
MIPRIALATAILAAAASLPGAPALARDAAVEERDCVAAGCFGIAGITAKQGTNPAWHYEVQVENRDPDVARPFRISFRAPGATSTANPRGYLLRGGQSYSFPLGHSAHRIPDEVLRASTQIRCLA